MLLNIKKTVFYSSFETIVERKIKIIFSNVDFAYLFTRVEHFFTFLDMHRPQDLSTAHERRSSTKFTLLEKESLRMGTCILYDIKKCD